jgi:beta-mannanase
MMRSISRAVIVALIALLVAPPASSADVRQIALGVSKADDKSLAAVDAFTAQVGRAPAIWTVWSTWGYEDKAFPTQVMNGLRDRNIVPMVNWQPAGAGDCTQWSLDNIINGDHDAYIREWASAAKQYGGTILLRFAHEMNGYWFIWGVGRCTNTTAKFQQAWRHVWNIFRGPGGVDATNVKFVWSIYGPKRVAALYPGDAYVDYLGLTAFNWGPPRGWSTMVKNFKRSMPALMRVSQKPIIAAEMGGAHVPSCGRCNKITYLSNGYSAVYNKWPQIAALVYFDLDMRFVNQPDWRLTSPAGVLDAYRNIVAQPQFQGVIQ